MPKETKMRGKHCPYCRNPFTPNPKVRHRQKTCGNPDCQKALKKENNARWREANSDYYRHDYPRVRRWLDQHRSYLRQYRGDHPEYVQRDREAKRLRYRQKKLRGDIQAEIRKQVPEMTKKLWEVPRGDIQAKISLQPLEMTFLLSTFPCLDIQAPMDKGFCARDNGIIETRM
jgi:hypothetical protein